MKVCDYNGPLSSTTACLLSRLGQKTSTCTLYELFVKHEQNVKNLKLRFVPQNFGYHSQTRLINKSKQNKYLHEQLL